MPVTLGCVPCRFDPDLIQDPTVYRFYEAIMHNGEAIKALINGMCSGAGGILRRAVSLRCCSNDLFACEEECGDGIMSAIDMYATVDTVVGKQVGPAPSGPLFLQAWSYVLWSFLDQIQSDSCVFICRERNGWW